MQYYNLFRVAVVSYITIPKTLRITTISILTGVINFKSHQNHFLKTDLLILWILYTKLCILIMYY